MGGDRFAGTAPTAKLAVRDANGDERPEKLSDRGGLHFLVSPGDGRCRRMGDGVRGRRKSSLWAFIPLCRLRMLERRALRNA